MISFYFIERDLIRHLVPAGPLHCGTEQKGWLISKFHGHIGINDDFPPVLDAGSGQEAVLVALGREVTQAEEVVDSFESIYIALLRCGNRRNGFNLLLAEGVFEQFLKVSNGERCDGCRVFDKHSSTKIKLMKTQPVVRVTQINLRQIWKGKIGPAIAQKADFTVCHNVERVCNPMSSYYTILHPQLDRIRQSCQIECATLRHLV